MMKKTIFITVLLCFFWSSKFLFAQDLSHLGFLPRINYTTSISERLSFNGTLFSEVDLADNQVVGTIFPSKVLNLTLIGGIGYKLNAHELLTLGYLYRIIDPFEENTRVEHRLIQQYVHIQHWGSLRIRHHLRSEERFIESPLSNGTYNGILRLSYSLGWDVPLQGKHLDTNEFYLNSVSSYFIQPSKPRTTFNNLNEFYLGLGYVTKKLGRFEIGPEAKISVRNSNKDLNVLVFIDVIWYPVFSSKRK